MRQVVKSSRATDLPRLLERIQEIGQRLVLAQPKEMAVGNIVRRVLGVIRDEAEEEREPGTSSYSDADGESRPETPKENDARSDHRPAMSSSISTFSPLRVGGIGLLDTCASPVPEHPASDMVSTAGRPTLFTSHTSHPVASSTSTTRSMFNLLSHPASNFQSQSGTPGSQSPRVHSSLTIHTLATLNAAKDLRAEVIDAIDEIVDELNQADDQIAAYALEHIHSNEIILTHATSYTVQKFLLKAAAKRKFTVIHAEAFPNDHEGTHAIVTGSHQENHEGDGRHELFHKLLTSAGITVILIPDSAIFAIMSRVNKVILGTQVVLADGGLVTTAGARTIAKAASVHCTPVVVLSPTYKLSPVYPFDYDDLIEYGDAGKVLEYEDGDLVDKVNVENPLSDYVPADLVDLFITNL